MISEKSMIRWDANARVGLRQYSIPEIAPLDGKRTCAALSITRSLVCMPRSWWRQNVGGHYDSLPITRFDTNNFRMHGYPVRHAIQVAYRLSLCNLHLLPPKNEVRNIPRGFFSRCVLSSSHRSLPFCLTVFNATRKFIEIPRYSHYLWPHIWFDRRLTRCTKDVSIGNRYGSFRTRSIDRRRCVIEWQFCESSVMTVMTGKNECQGVSRINVNINTPSVKRYLNEIIFVESVKVIHL